jgi:hypothetical protein
MGKIMAKPPGKCIYCERSALIASLTHEHIWAEWLQPYVTKLDAHERVLHRGTAFWSQKTTKRQNFDMHSRRVYKVCGECNNGWMSKLQELARPTILKIIDNRLVRITRSERITLSAWVGMLVMIADFDSSASPAISQADRAHLYKNRQMPKSWRI